MFIHTFVCNFVCSTVWVLGLVSQFGGETQIEGVRK